MEPPAETSVQKATTRYPREFSEKERNVYLEGEAYFEVTKNRHKPFTVQSDAIHPLNKGMLGMHGNLGPNINTNKCDVLIAVGMRFDDRVTGNLCPDVHG